MSETPVPPAESATPTPERATQQSLPAPIVTPLTLFAVQDHENTHIMVQASGDNAICLFTYPRKLVALARTMTVVSVGGFPPFDQDVRLLNLNLPAPAPAAAPVATRQQRRAAKSKKGNRK
jgi:hypothetical protein